MTKSKDYTTRKKKMVTLSLHQMNLMETTYPGYQRLRLPQAEVLRLSKKTGRRHNTKPIIFPTCKGTGFFKPKTYMIDKVIIQFDNGELIGSNLEYPLEVVPCLSPMFAPGAIKMRRI